MAGESLIHVNLGRSIATQHARLIESRSGIPRGPRRLGAERPTAEAIAWRLCGSRTKPGLATTARGRFERGLAPDNRPTPGPLVRLLLGLKNAYETTFGRSCRRHCGAKGSECSRGCRQCRGGDGHAGGYCRHEVRGRQEDVLAPRRPNRMQSYSSSGLDVGCRFAQLLSRVFLPARDRHSSSFPTDQPQLSRAARDGLDGINAVNSGFSIFDGKLPSTGS